MRAGAQPYLGARIAGPATKMIDRVLIPAGWLCGRSVCRGRPGRGALAAGSIREPTANHRRDDGQARRIRCRSGCGGDHLLADRCGLDRGERLVAELAQDLVGAPAELAGDREAGAVVVDPAGDLAVVLVLG